MYGTKLYLILVLVSFFVTAFVFSLLINGLFLRFSKTLGIRHNQENLIRWSSSNKPAFGGISFYIIFLISLAATSFFFLPNLGFHNIGFLGFVISATIAFMMGLFDDAFNTRVWLKLTAQIACGVILILTGTQIEFFAVDWIDKVITVLWVVGMMNSINMLDNMDGITSIVSVFILSAFLFLLLLGHQLTSPFTIIMTGLIAAILGFLYFNWNPSKMYMGDTGSQFLGFLLAFFGILYAWNMDADPNQHPLVKKGVMLAVMFALPLTDTLTVVFKRIRRGRSPFIGGRDHTTHHLSYLGLSDRKVAIVYLCIAFCSSTLFILGSTLPYWGWWYTILFCLFFLLVFVALFVIANRNTGKSV